ncbi:hypothetical protein Asppvi_006097 [Aspergillus pseudoviridinutans]|uniref:Uncharacterized protein n=1 Tax=Aspergillus pseudoviridinutans TaxID=1517512 RepID=A0A9P3ET64_9EURO|nr:uncharacterized protein Asppvi_006097 [Aspergillus pseudoviridinutans]GIJ87191.1 hypothetical protein Asppvi_006097 [Aspergillus pseudoviridinutans]
MDTQDCPDSIIHRRGSSHLNEEPLRTFPRGQQGDIEDTSIDKFQSNVTDRGRIESERQRNLREDHKIENGDQIASAALPGPRVSAADVRPKSSDMYPSRSYTPGHLSRSASPDCIDQSGSGIPTLSSSSIFERDVQKDLLPVHTSPSIPSHISMEDHIPPVLEASSVAITDDRLSPDTVEIVTRNVHQSATAGVCGAFAVEPSLPSSCFEHVRDGSEDLEEPHSPCKTLESTNVRRLSFVSFADVVNAEHAEATDFLSSRESSHQSPSMRNSSPSPLRSPKLLHELDTCTVTSTPNSIKASDLSSSRESFAAGSPRLAVQRPISPNVGGEFSIETMRQALRRTGSEDLIIAKDK